MKMTCKDRERIFEEGTAAEWAALEGHAESCASCAEELRAWKSLSVAAAEMRDYTGSPALWPRIHQALAEQGATIQQQREPWSWRSLFTNLSVSWRTAAATALVVVLMVSAGWLLRTTNKPPIQQGSLLKSKALVEVEHAESAYVQAIDKLAIEAKPQIDNPATPLMADYREKLLVLDSAIDDLRAQAGQNASNAHLRYELLAMYQEKQRTLEEILEAKR
jgi:hypothetical protein